MMKRDYVMSTGCPGDKAQNLEMLDAVAQEFPWPVVLAAKGPLADIRCRALPHLDALDGLDAEEMATKLGQAAIFALPTRYEPFGFTSLAAALSGCARVLGDIPSLRETWGEAALFVAPDDKDAFAAVLHGLAEDADLRREMGARARACALEFTPERMAGSILECYQELLVRQTTPPQRDRETATAARAIEPTGLRLQ